MSEFRTIFRHCPQCGRRFEIRLVGRELAGERQETEDVPHATMQGVAGMGGLGAVVVRDDVPISIDVRDFRYTYRCKHCGHTWAEFRTSEKKT